MAALFLCRLKLAIATGILQLKAHGTTSEKGSLITNANNRYYYFSRW